MTRLVLLVALLLSSTSVFSQDRPQQGRQGSGRFGGPIELGPDDKQIYPDPEDSIVAQ